MIRGSGIYEFTPLVKEVTTLPPTDLTDLDAADTIDELGNLVQEVKKLNTHKDIMLHLDKINQKIDLVRKSVQRLCESTAACIETTFYEQ